ncbi:MAG: shikimate kinase [Deltaproteobacteria bacterium]|nr:shikimate kinase [Deltaproteobacteria bacterium]
MANIVLTGFMGTGKSTIGRVLSRETGLKFMDLDELIEREAGMAIKDIFRERGEGCFRDMESGVIRRLTQGEFGNGLIVSTGGGAVVRKENRDALRSWGTVVCLSSTVDEILRRVENRDDRPLLNTVEKKEAIERLLKEREEAYGDCDLVVDTASVSLKEAVRAIKNFVEERTKNR